jgi:hypothetical protein
MVEERKQWWRIGNNGGGEGTKVEERKQWWRIGTGGGG